MEALIQLYPFNLDNFADKVQKLCFVTMEVLECMTAKLISNTLHLGLTVLIPNLLLSLIETNIFI